MFHLFSVKKFEEAMTAEEKAKLFAAIDYKENAAPSMYPKTFVENTFTFLLRSLVLEVKTSSLSHPVLRMEIGGVVTKVEQRPSAEAMRLVSLSRFFFPLDPLIKYEHKRYLTSTVYYCF